MYIRENPILAYKKWVFSRCLFHGLDNVMVKTQNSFRSCAQFMDISFHFMNISGFLPHAGVKDCDQIAKLSWL